MDLMEGTVVANNNITVQKSVDVVFKWNNKTNESSIDQDSEDINIMISIARRTRHQVRLCICCIHQMTEQ